MWCDAAATARAPRPRGSLARAALALALGVLLTGAAAPPAAPAQEDLFRQVKVDVFDQDWAAVLRGCEEILSRYPDGVSAAQASFYRARALTRLPGRRADGVKAFRDFIASHPRDKVLTEQAWSSLFSAACEPPAASSPECLRVLKDGLSSESRYVSTLAAIRASDTADPELRRLALLTLKRAYDAQAEPEIRDEILIAILKIDPKQVPTPEPPRSPAPPRAPGAAGKSPSLIRMSVYNKLEKRYELRVNLPVAFARMLIDAVGEDQKQELRHEAREKGIDLDDIFKAIEKSGAGKLLEVDDETSHIEIWIE